MTYRVKPINNSTIITNEQMHTMADARAKQVEETFAGKTSNGETVTANVVFDDNATIAWEYNDYMYDKNGNSLNNGLELGYADEIGNTQENRTQVSVIQHFSFDEEGQIIFDDAGVQESAKTGTHEDGHVSGLNHPDYTVDAEIAKEMLRDSESLMLDSGGGTNIGPKQRTLIIKNVEDQQE